MQIIADEKLIYRSPDPANLYCFTPSICHGANGRLIASTDLSGPGYKNLGEPLTNIHPSVRGNQLRIFVSDDQGETWRMTGKLPMLHTTLFAVGTTLYAIGHGGKLLIARSTDNGETWSAPSVLEEKHWWQQSATTVDFRNGKIYLVQEYHLFTTNCWPNVCLVFMSAKADSDLLDPKNWTFSKPFDMDKYIRFPNDLGFPFFLGDTDPENTADTRRCDPPAILESCIFRIYDQKHVFYDPQDRTVMILSRLHTGMSNMATLLKGVEAEDGSLSIEFVMSPAGARMFFIPFPGGQMKFHMTYDEKSKLYWMVSSQTTDSFTRPDLLPRSRYNLPNNERNRLMLSFSKNGFDWCMAGMIALGRFDKESRHYASILLDGDDLLVASRSGDKEASTPHNGDLITLHRVKDFRSLIY